MVYRLRSWRFGVISTIALCCMLLPLPSYAQQDAAPAQNVSLNSNSADNNSTGTPTFRTRPAPDPGDLEVSWRKMPARFLQDEKDVWLFPSKAAEGQTWPPAEIAVRRIADGRLDIATLPSGTFERDARGEDSAEQDATRRSSQPQTQMQGSDHPGLVMRSVKRTLEDQKELYLTPFKPANFKWDALELGGTAALLASDRHIEKHIGTAHYTFYQASSDIAIAGLGATLAGVWAWGIKGDHPHAKETGVLELETLVNTFLIYTPMQLLAARQRPGEGNGNGDFWKHHNINTSFPGGHAMFTFAMATVVSHEYPQKWVQVLAYSAASMVTVTRFMARDHWSSDMFVGTALGIGIGSHIFHAHCNPELSDSCKHHTRWIF